ncbi:MAG: trigger factor [Bacteroidales bacterium]|jgi:trigger factor|nr:trigger factor [Bacteroidales bacterium]
MNISKQVVDDVNIVLSLEIEKADYAEAVEKELKKIRKRVQMPGFRPGMVPEGLVRKQYGTSVKVEEVNKVISDSLFSYIRDNKLNVLGEPMADETSQVDIVNDDNFTLKFNVAVAPEFELKLDKTVKVPYYTIKVEDKMMNDQIEGMRRQYGSTVQVDDVEENDVVKGDIAELDENGNIKEGGIVASNATILPRYMQGEDEKKKFIGAKKLTSVDFNPAAAYNNNQSEIASLLQKPQAEIAGITANFRFTISEISRRKLAEMNEEFFKSAYGEECTTEEAFKAKVSDTIAAQLATNSEYKFNLDAKDALMKQVGTLKFPEETLKKWLLAKDEKRDEKKLDEDFPRMMEDLTWQLIEEKVVSAKEIKLNDDDLKNEAREMLKAQMMQYGMSDLPEEYMNSYAESMLKDDKQRGQLRDGALARKVMAEIKSAVSITKKEVTLEKFQEMFK